MKKQIILFNLDDTLVECNIYFNQVIEQFTKQMTEWFPTISGEEISQMQLEVDMKSIETHGLKSERFPQSFLETYEHYCELTGRIPSIEERTQLRELGESVFKIPVEAYPFMHQTLKKLKDEGHALYLHTGGDEENQRRKIAQMELTMYFEHRIFISNHKDTRALSDILKTLNADPSETWMVGNSIRTDVLPALELGVNCIYIPAKTEWEYNMVEINIEPKAAFFTLTELREVPQTIHAHVNGEKKTNMDEMKIPTGLPVMAQQMDNNQDFIR